ncbi:hypothetical protein HS088_TW07G01138 [Tripterygium wilfordii]|uniref:Uncharacterized protein n=1 Tax=Tripterygium wilfordii TaxID=458696 RepID=A0A7J7DHK9_TRIWF|nr:hypothetical protein HS088_TW07G01138 [Tripterygium wilfordii]
MMLTHELLCLNPNNFFYQYLSKTGIYLFLLELFLFSIWENIDALISRANVNFLVSHLLVVLVIGPFSSNCYYHCFGKTFLGIAVVFTCLWCCIQMLLFFKS